MSTQNETAYCAYFDLDEFRNLFEKHNQEGGTEDLRDYLEKHMTGYGENEIAASLELLTNLLTSHLVKICEEDDSSENTMTETMKNPQAGEGEDYEHSDK